MSGRGKNLLIVTQDASAGAMISRFLRSKGFTIKTTTGADEAQQLLDTWQADLLFLEAHGNSEEALAALRSLRSHRDDHESSREVPIVLGTGFSWEKKAEREVKQLGVSAIVIDPLQNLSHLVSTLDKALEKISPSFSGTSEGIPDRDIVTLPPSSPTPERTKTAASPSPPPQASPSPPPVTRVEPPSVGAVQEEEIVGEKPEPAGPKVTTRKGMVEHARRALPASGQLRDMDVAELVYECHVGGATGLLSLSKDGNERTIYFDKGAPVQVNANEEGTSLGVLLERSGLLSPDQHRALEDDCRSSKKTSSKVLLDRGLVSPHVLVEVLTERLLERLVTCFEWEEGVFSFNHRAKRGEDVVPLNLSPPRIIVTGIARHYTLPRVEALCSITDNSQLYRRHDGPTKREALLLTTLEARLFELAIREQPVSDLVEAANSREEALKFLYALFLMEFVGFKTQPVAATRARRHRSRKERPAPASKGQVVQSEEGPAFLEEIAKLEDADFFELLGVERAVSSEELHKVFRTRVKRYHPDAVGKLSDGDVRDRALQLYRRMVEGLQVLANPKTRSEYLRELETSPSAARARDRRGSSSPSNNPKTVGDMLHRPAPEEVFSKVEGFIEDERYEEALKLIRSSKAKHSKDARCIAWYGWVLYLESPRVNLHEAERQLGFARNLDPKHPVPYQLMARVRTREGAIDRAHELYCKARSLAPEDRRLAAEAKHVDELIHDDREKNSSDDATAKGGRGHEFVKLLKQLHFGKRS